jgi:hypothetical protein
MSFQDTIRSRFKTKVADVKSLTTQYDNQNVTLPDDSTSCRFAIKTGDVQKLELGDTNFRERLVGVCYAQLFCPIGLGDGDLITLADFICDCFRNITVSGVSFLSPAVKPIGRSGSLWQINVEIPFTYSSLKQKAST